MLSITDSPPSSHTIMVLRPAGRTEPSCPWVDMLREQGLALGECFTADAASTAVRNGCRIGLLIVARQSELAHLDQCAPFVGNTKICWVGLVAQDLVSMPRMRRFIGEHLFNFITVPADPEHIMLTLRRAWGAAFMRDTRQTSAHLPLPADEKVNGEFPMLGDTPPMQRLRGQIKKVARTDAPVLITGPSGAGKEIAALAIHRQSARGNARFVAIDCGAIAPQRLQSDLRGGEKVARHDTRQREIERIKAAQGGTLFLDEIDNMPCDMQAELLRLLKEGTVEQVDGNGANEIDVRVIGATRVDLVQAVSEGRFREDLYHRINVISIDIPKLADRGQDIEDIAKHYFSGFASAHNRSLRGFSKAAMNAMLSHAWPGNVRELVNRVQRATVMAEGRFLQPEDLGFERETEQPLMSLQDARAAAECMMIRRALSQSRNQISRAATLLGVSRVTLYRLIEKYNIRSDMAPPATASFRHGATTDLEARE